jgi:Tfp pilus assembly protein PilF
VFAQAEASHSNSPEMLVYIAQMHETAGTADQAERVYRKALELVPDHGLALTGYGSLLLKTDRIEAATQLAMLLSNSTSPDWTLLGRFASELVHRKQFAPAETLLRKLVKRKPQHARGHLLLAHCIYNNAGASEALPYAAEAARLGPNPKAEKLLARLESETRRAAVPAVE